MYASHLAFIFYFQDDVQNLILQRNEVQKRFYSVVEEFILEVEDLPISNRLETLQVGETILCTGFVCFQFNASMSTQINNIRVQCSSKCSQS